MPVIDSSILKDIPLFSLLDEQERAVLAQNLDERSFLAGQIIIHEGEPGNAMFVVGRGQVELFIKDKEGQKVILEHVQPGELFGELSLLDEAPRSASAIATQNTTLYVIDRTDLEILVAAHPAAALDMLSALGKRLRLSNSLVGERTSRNANIEAAEDTTLGQRISDVLTHVAGDIRFVYFSVIWFFVWIVLNTRIIPGLEPFDPFPFGLLTMVVSLEAIFLSLFVLISQNRQAERDKVRNDIEYEVNLRAEIEVRQVFDRIDDLQELLLSHLNAIQQGNDHHEVMQTVPKREVQE